MIRSLFLNLIFLRPNKKAIEFFYNYFLSFSIMFLGKSTKLSKSLFLTDVAHKNSTSSIDFSKLLYTFIVFLIISNAPAELDFTLSPFKSNLV